MVRGRLDTIFRFTNIRVGDPFDYALNAHLAAYPLGPARLSPINDVQTTCVTVWTEESQTPALLESAREPIDYDSESSGGTVLTGNIPNFECSGAFFKRVKVTVPGSD